MWAIETTDVFDEWFDALDDSTRRSRVYFALSKA